MKKQEYKNNLNLILSEKNVAFLIGSGASNPFFSSLQNFENVLSNEINTLEIKNLVKILFYYSSIYKNNLIFDILNDKNQTNESLNENFRNYKWFIHNILEYLKIRNNRVSPKRINIFTTNYDVFIEAAIDYTIKNDNMFHFNDGTVGYTKKIFNINNYNKKMSYSGFLDDYSNDIPTINLIKCHGSINWIKNTNNEIEIDFSFKNLTDINYKIDNLKEKINKDTKTSLEDLINCVTNSNLNEEFISISSNYQKEISDIINLLNELQIVYPTKKKFGETLIYQQYYSSLRFLSYELEKNKLH